MDLMIDRQSATSECPTEDNSTRLRKTFIFISSPRTSSKRSAVPLWCGVPSASRMTSALVEILPQRRIISASDRCSIPCKSFHNCASSAGFISCRRRSMVIPLLSRGTRIVYRSRVVGRDRVGSGPRLSRRRSSSSRWSATPPNNDGPARRTGAAALRTRPGRQAGAIFGRS